MGTSSAKTIGASRHISLHNRPEIRLQPCLLNRHTHEFLQSGRRPYKRLPRRRRQSSPQHSRSRPSRASNCWVTDGLRVRRSAALNLTCLAAPSKTHCALALNAYSPSSAVCADSGRFAADCNRGCVQIDLLTALRLHVGLIPDRDEPSIGMPDHSSERGLLVQGPAVGRQEGPCHR